MRGDYLSFYLRKKRRKQRKKKKQSRNSRVLLCGECWFCVVPKKALILHIILLRFPHPLRESSLFCSVFFKKVGILLRLHVKKTRKILFLLFLLCFLGGLGMKICLQNDPFIFLPTELILFFINSLCRLVCWHSFAFPCSHSSCLYFSSSSSQYLFSLSS